MTPHPSQGLPGDRPSDRTSGAPQKLGLFDPRFEHDACGVAFVVDVHGRRSHRMVQLGLQSLCNLDHRGATNAEPNVRSEEHTSELQSLMRISYAVFCLKKKNANNTETIHTHQYTTDTHKSDAQTGT